RKFENHGHFYPKGPQKAKISLLTAVFRLKQTNGTLAKIPKFATQKFKDMTKDGKIELMAPAGNFESLQAALDNGADSVYFGVDQLNMRARASINFTMDDLPQISKRCTALGVRTYLTLNTIIYDHDLSVIKTLIDKAKEAQITALIAMDQAVIAYARQVGMEVHISTQINVTIIESVRFYA